MAFPVPSAPPKFSLEQISCTSKLNVAFAFEQLDKHSYILGCFQNLRVFALHDDCGIASWGPLRTGVHGYGHRHQWLHALWNSLPRGRVFSTSLIVSTCLPRYPYR